MFCIFFIANPKDPNYKNAGIASIWIISIAVCCQKTLISGGSMYYYYNFKGEDAYAFVSGCRNIVNWLLICTMYLIYMLDAFNFDENRIKSATNTSFGTSIGNNSSSDWIIN